MRTVTDQSGTQLQVPVHPQRIADLWFAHNAIMVMLGGTDRIAVTADTEAREPWMFRVAPALRQALQLDGPVPTAETLLAAHVDLAVATKGSPAAAVARSVNLPAPAVGFQNAEGLIQCIDLTADLLNDDRARTAAQAYARYLKDVIARIEAKTKGLTDAERPRVLHIQSLHPLRVDGPGTMIDDWIRIAGGRDAATGLQGGMKDVSIEQVAAWNPDVVILGNQTEHVDPAADGGVWHSIKAVQTDHVFTNPHGVFTWDRYGSEYPLQLLWTAKTLHPDLFADVDMVAETRAFYQRFFGYALSATDAQRILNGQPPAGTRFAPMHHGAGPGGRAH